MKSALQYLKDNNLSVSTGLSFTCGDYRFITENNFDSITINYNKESYKIEVLTKKDIINRIYDLYLMYKNINYDNSLREETILEILKEHKPEVFRKDKIKKLLNNGFIKS